MQSSILFKQRNLVVTMLSLKKTRIIVLLPQLWALVIILKFVSFCRKLLQVNPNNGEAYILIETPIRELQKHVVKTNAKNVLATGQHTINI